MLTWRQTTSAQVRQARTNILLRQTLRRWQALHRHHLGLPGTADQHRTHHLMSSALAKWCSALKNAELERKAKSFSESSTQRLLATCWIRWSDAAEKARRRRWEEEMNMRESTMMERSNSRSIRNTFTVGCACARLMSLILRRNGKADSLMSRPPLSTIAPCCRMHSLAGEQPRAKVELFK